MSSCLPTKKNFPFWKGSAFRYLFEWRDNNGKTVVSHDLTGYTGAATLTPLAGEKGVPLELSTENGGIIFGGVELHEPKNGLIEIYITRTQLDAIEFRKASYTLYAYEHETILNEVYPLLTGRFTDAGPPL
jgi:hypothetical protein